MTVRSLSLVALSLAALATAQDAKKDNPKAPAKAARDNVLAAVQDTPGLPRVLLVGDSISMGYTIPVREALKGVANVHRPPVNCGPTTRGVEQLDKWLGDGKWDVIHFNFGLHDLKSVDEKGKNTSPDKGKVQVTIEDYKKNLDAMVVRMKKTGAKLVFATTTPVPEKEPARAADADRAYNAAAREVMAKHGVAVDDLNAFVRGRKGEGMLPNNVHFTPDGYQALAGQVVAEVKKALGK
jgi:acyl-CoA thioesterase-1